VGTEQAAQMKASKPYDDSVIAMLKTDPEFAEAYLATALEEACLPGGQFALLAVLRHIAEAQGMAQVEVSR
jgi:DNA-binding phage protein